MGSLAVSRRRFKGNRHAVIGGSRSFRVLGAGFVLKHGCVAICPTLQLGHRSCGQFQHPARMETRPKRQSLMLNAYFTLRRKVCHFLCILENRKLYFLNYVRAIEYLSNELINEFFVKMLRFVSGSKF